MLLLCQATLMRSLAWFVCQSPTQLHGFSCATIPRHCACQPLRLTLTVMSHSRACGCSRYSEGQRCSDTQAWNILVSPTQLGQIDTGTVGMVGHGTLPAADAGRWCARRSGVFVCGPLCFRPVRNIHSRHPTAMWGVLRIGYDDSSCFRGLTVTVACKGPKRLPADAGGRFWYADWARKREEVHQWLTLTHLDWSKRQFPNPSGRHGGRLQQGGLHA